MGTEKLTTVERPDGVLSEQDFLAKLEVESVEIEVPEMGVSAKVLIRPLSIEQRTEAYVRAQDGVKVNSARFQALTLLKGMVRPQLTDKALPALLAGNPRAVDRIAKAIWKLSGLDDLEAVKNV